MPRYGSIANLGNGNDNGMAVTATATTAKMTTITKTHKQQQQQQKHSPSFINNTKSKQPYKQKREKINNKDSAVLLSFK